MRGNTRDVCSTLFGDKRLTKDTFLLLRKKNPSAQSVPRKSTPVKSNGCEEHSPECRPLESAERHSFFPKTSKQPSLLFDSKPNPLRNSLNPRPRSSISPSKIGKDRLRDTSDACGDLKWAKNDPKFKTCDSVTLLHSKADQTLKKAYSSSKLEKAEKVSFSPKSIINSIETMTRKSVNFYIDRPNIQQKENIYTRLSSSSKLSSSNQNLQTTQKICRGQASRLFNTPTSLEKTQKNRPEIRLKCPQSQTKENLKDMITQEINKCLDLLPSDFTQTKKTTKFRDSPRKSFSPAICSLKAPPETTLVLEKCLYLAPDSKPAPKEQANPVWQYYTTSLRKHLACPDPLDPMATVFKDHLQLAFNSVRLSRVLDYAQIEEFLHRNKLTLLREPADSSTRL